MPAHRKISQALQYHVRQRAMLLCEYCHASEQWQYVRFTVDHVIPVTLGGTDTSDNLALACFHCNRRKSNRLTARDPESEEEVSLFNPRESPWHEHFIWSADSLLIIGLTPTGRASVQALNLNRSWAINIRSADKAVGRHPPPEDPIQVSALLSETDEIMSPQENE